MSSAGGSRRRLGSLLITPPPSRGRIAPRRPCRLLYCLAVEGEVETLAFRFGVDTKPDREINQFEQYQRHDHIIDDRDGHAVELHDDLMWITVDQAALAFATNPSNGQHAGQDRADHPADAVHPEGIETVVISERVLETGGGPITYDTRRNADDQGAARVDKTRCRGDRDETGDRTRDDPEHARLSLDDPFGEHPGESRCRGRDLGHRHRHARITVGCRCRPGVKAEPPDPEKRCANYAEHEIVRRH